LGRRWLTRRRYRITAVSRLIACWVANRPYNGSVHRLFTPLLRRIYRVFGVFVALYLVSLAVQYSSWNKERLYRKLISARPADEASAAFDLAYLNGERQLLRALQNGSPTVQDLARHSLEELWARAAGHEAFRQLLAARRAVERQAYNEALAILTRLTRERPSFPQVWNQRAPLFCHLGRFEDAVADARKTVGLNPNHFAAWQGMGVCQVHLGDINEACRSLRKALRIAPHDQHLRFLLLRCEEILNQTTPGESVHYDLI